MKHKIFATLLVSMGCVGTAQAAEKIRYEDLRYRLATFGTVVGGFQVKVITRDGSKHTGRALLLSVGSVQILQKNDVAKEDILSEDIARIEIKRGEYLFEYSLGSAEIAVVGPKFICSLDVESPSPKCLAPMALLISPALMAFAVASAPITLAVDGVHLLMPAKVYEIVH
jgi:hypothetical protein